MIWSVYGVNRVSFKGSKKSRQYDTEKLQRIRCARKAPFLVCMINIPLTYFTAFCFGSSGFANMETLIEAASVHSVWILTTFFPIKYLSIVNGGKANKLRVHNVLIAEFKRFGYICLQTIIYVRNKGKAHYWSSYAFVRTELQQCERKKPTDNTNNSKESLSVQTIRLHLPSKYYICPKQGQSALLKLICICPHRTAAIRTKKPTDNTNNSKESLSVPKFRSQVNRTTQPLHRLCTSFSTGGQIC